MKSAFSLILVAAFSLMLSVVSVSAQNREKFIISAKAGGINFTSGSVETTTRGADWSLLAVTDDLKTGDIVRTGSDGRVEMLLNPGSYLRVGENSEFQLADNSLENLEVKLIRGTAIIEATGAEETELAINITTPHAKMVIVRRGLYRVNVIPGDATELFVRKGRVMLANSHTRVKEGNKVIFSATTFSVAKLDKADKQKDGIEKWSKDRSQTVALANQKISSRDLNSFMTGFNDFWGSSFLFRHSGFWLFNPRSRCYTFLPFYPGWGSPYGLSYSYFWDCGCYGFRPFWGQRSPVGYSNSRGNTSGSGSSSSAGSTSGDTRRSIPPPPSRSGSLGGDTPRALPAPATSNSPGRGISSKPDTNPEGGRVRPQRPN